MPRSWLTDPLQNHLFWAFDIPYSEGKLSVPILTPLFGFSSITAPSISLEMSTFKDGTYIYNRNVVKSANVAPITFQRAATIYESDFYNWIKLAIHGQGGDAASIGWDALSNRRVRRDLVIIQFTRVNADSTIVSAIDALSSISSSAAEAGISNVSGGMGLGPFAYARRVPGRAWRLYECLPTKYTAAEQFDAKSAEVSIMSLEVLPEYIEQYQFSI